MKFKGIIPKELIDSINNNKCILFVGSGISASVKRENGVNLPTWHNFLIELLEFAKSKNVMFWNGSGEIKDIIDKGNYLLAAEELQECIPLGEFAEFLNITFRDKNVKPSNIHKSLSKIAFRCVLTSNYDTLIEGGYTLANNGQMPLKFVQEDLNSIASPLRKEDFFIFKIHGDIDRPETIILGSRSYNQLLFKSPEYLHFLQTLFTTNTVLFVGFSGSDIDLDFTIDRLSTIYSRTLHKHFILLPENKYNLTEKRRLLKDKRLEVIDYVVDKNHSQVEIFFKSLNELTTQGSKPKSKNKSKGITSLNRILLTSRYLERQTELMDIFNVGSWFMGILDNNEIPEEIIMNVKIKQIIIIIDTEFMKSKILENLFELIIIRDTESKVMIIPIVIGNLNLPPIVRNNSLYFKVGTGTIEEVMNSLRVVASKIL